MSLSTFNICFAKKVKIAFFINFLSVRGSEVALYDYADCNETILGNESIIINNTKIFGDSNNSLHADSSDSAREKFIKRFGDRFFNCTRMEEIDAILSKEKVDIFYVLTWFPERILSKVCKNAIHAVFALNVYGDAYACISEWLSNRYPSLHVPFVPHMIRLDKTTQTLHEELKIPHGAPVFGRHGGFNQFNIPFAQEAVQEIAQRRKDWYFIFLNTNQFCNLPNVIFLPRTADMVYKTKFINTCDAMIHAQSDGETFGLACGEFSIKNKPVITYLKSYYRCHISILGDKGLYYITKEDLINIVESCGTHIQEVRSGSWDAYSEKYNPEMVMKKFNEVFIKPLMNTD